MVEEDSWGLPVASQKERNGTRCAGVPPASTSLELLPYEGSRTSSAHTYATHSYCRYVLPQNFTTPAKEAEALTPPLPDSTAPLHQILERSPPPAKDTR